MTFVIQGSKPLAKAKAKKDDTFAESLLPALPIDLIRDAYMSAAGNEIESGRFANPESSAALAANAFGFFLDRRKSVV